MEVHTINVMFLHRRIFERGQEKSSIKHERTKIATSENTEQIRRHDFQKRELFSKKIGKKSGHFVVNVKRFLQVFLK